MKTNITKLMMVLAAATLAACGEKDLYNGDDNVVTPENTELNEINAKAEYAYNFSAKYSNVNLNTQSWDFSHKSSTYSLGEQTTAARTRAEGGSWSKGSWYEVDNATLDWMHKKLTEGEDHRNLGTPFYMSVPGNDFTIVPIYQGVASAVWSLHVVIGGVDYNIWGKSEEIEIKDVRNQDWHSVVQPTYEWGGEGAWWEALFNTDGGDKWTAPESEGGVRNVVTNVRAIPRTFSGFPVGADMYFYLEIRTGDEGRCNVGDQESSLNGMMLALQDVPRPANIPDDYETMIIGCEDAHLSLSDHDMNDVVFLVYGKSVPKPIKIEQGSPIYESKTVRYMIEDLGSTDDFDFNDIVIDVTESTAKTPVYVNDVLSRWNMGATTQKAVIRHLGGILPFTLTIGNTELPEMGGQNTFQSDPNLSFDVTGWNMNTHNVSVEVQQQNNQGVFKVTFPKAGEAPMIIAVDPWENWMSERKSVPESWFYSPNE